jgi:hypothetical protein
MLPVRTSANCLIWHRNGVALKSDPVNEIEYKILVTDAPTASEAQLNGFGKEGWQLATILQFGGKWYYYLQRIKQPN